MKRLTPRYRHWLLVHAKASDCRRQQSARWAKERQYRGWEVKSAPPQKRVSVYRAGQYEEAILTGEPRSVPAILSLGENYEETAAFLADIRGGLTEGWQGYARLRAQKTRAGALPKRLRTYWDFTSIREITPAVALVIASEYDRVRRRQGWVPYAIDFENWKPDVRRLLDGIGFLDMVGIHSEGETFIEGENWRMLRFRSGDLADGEQVGQLLEELGIPEALESPELYDAIVEALVNTRHHAYPTTHYFPEPHFPGWWLTALVDRANRRLRISAFDHGLSIPGTLRTWDKYPLYQRAWRRLFQSDPDANDPSWDGAAIATAMDVGRTSTGEHYRGRGLPAIDAAVDLCREGRITIYSRSGEYLRAKGDKPRYMNRNTPIGGTLVIWDLRF